jgi:hypothetical protein
VARKARDFRKEYQARQARARAAGYESYYGKRVRAGKPPSAPAPSGVELARARGHLSAADFRRELSEGAHVYVEGHKRGKDGRISQLDLRVVDGRSGKERTFRLRGKQITREALRRLVDQIERENVSLSGTPSLDLRLLANEV